MLSSTTLVVLCVALWLLGGIPMVLYLGKPSITRWCRPLAVFWVFYVIHVQGASLQVYFGEGWDQTPGMWHYPLIVAAAPFFVFVGAFLTGRRPGWAWDAWWSKPLVIRQNVAVPIWVIFVVGVLLLGVQIWASGGRIALIEFFRVLDQGGQGEELNIIRRASARLPLAAGYLVSWNSGIVLPLAVLSALAVYVAIRSGLLRFLMVLFVAIFEAGYTIARWPLAFLLIKLTAIYFLISRRKLGPVKAVAIFLLVLSFPVIVTNARSTGDWSAGGLWKTTQTLVLNRVLSAPSFTVGAHVSHVPAATGGFLWGRSIGWLARITGQMHYPLPVMVDRQYHGLGSQGHMNTCYVGDAWCNFGWAGVVFYSLFVGFWLGMQEVLLLRPARTPIAAAAVVVAAFQPISLINSALQLYLLTYGGILITIILWIIASRSERQAAAEGYDLEAFEPMAPEGSMG